METSPNPALRLAIAAWRASLPPMPDDTVAELEGHLLDSTAELQKAGLSASEGFLIARRRLGDPSELGEESADALPLPGPVASANTIARRTQTPRNTCAKGLTALGVAAILAAIAIPLWFTFTPYSASAMLEILRTSTILEFGSFRSPLPADIPSGPNQEFFATQLEVITAPETLKQVAKKLGLAERWKVQSQDQAIRRLRKMVRATAATGSNLIRVTAQSQDRKEAAELAEEVANAYIERRKKLDQQRVDLVHVTLFQSRKGQELVVEKARTKMIEFVQQLGISDPAPEGSLYPTHLGGDPVDPAHAVLYTKARADYQLQSKILGDMVSAQEDARLTNLMPRWPATFHEHAAVPPERSILNFPVWWSIAGGSGGVGSLLLVLGLRRKAPRKVQIDNYTIQWALA
jgi:hypothetical protein